MFANRLRKNLRSVGRWARREGVTNYRLYDADLPEYAVAVDVYQEDSNHMFKGKVGDVNEAYLDGHVERVAASWIKCCYQSGNAWVCR